MADDPLEAYKRLAKKYGIDSDDEDAMVDFLRNDLQFIDPSISEQAYLEVLHASTGFDFFDTRRRVKQEAHSENPWVPHLMRVVDGGVNLELWDFNIIRYMQEEISPKLLELHRLEVNQYIALDEVFRLIQPDENRTDLQRAQRVVLWSRYHRSPSVMDAFVRYLSHTSAHLSASNTLQRDDACVELQSLVIEHLCYLEPLLKECARLGPLTKRRRLYEDLMNALRKVCDFEVSVDVYTELVVLEREYVNKVRYLEQLIGSVDWSHLMELLERRLGFQEFYSTIRILVDKISSAPPPALDDSALSILHWVESFVNRSDVNSRDRVGIPDFERDWGAPIRDSWMRLQEILLSEASIERALVGV